MSTSPSRSPAVDAPAEEKPVLQFRPFPYDSIPAGARESMLDSLIAASAGAQGGNADEAAREIAARAQGRQEGQAEARKIFEDQLALERTHLTAALAAFTQDRAAYFQKVEGEVVQLALSIARKIMHRESQLDPMLLAGIVRVALEKMEGATEVVLRVHPQRAAEWRTHFSLHVDPGALPEIVEDPAQDPQACVLQTSMGTAVAGVEVQLKEIEQGLMDLLAARPGTAPGARS